MVQTLFELFWGLLAGSFLGFVGGVVLGEFDALRRIFLPYVVTSQVVPKLALAPLFIVWFGFGALPTVVMTALICFFPLLENTMTALTQTDTQQLALFRMLRASRWTTLWRLKLPQGLPVVLAGLRVAVVLAWVGAVVGEFTTASKGLGALIIAAQGSMDTALMFAVLVLITVQGWLMYQACGVLERYVLRKVGFKERS
jgi:NitT/TauT family transport system permease protein